MTQRVDGTVGGVGVDDEVVRRVGEAGVVLRGAAVRLLLPRHGAPHPGRHLDQSELSTGPPLTNHSSPG